MVQFKIWYNLFWKWEGISLKVPKKNDWEKISKKNFENNFKMGSRFSVPKILKKNVEK